MDHKEKWAKETLKSLQGIKRARPKDNLFDKIAARIPEGQKSKVIPLRYMAWTAVAASVIIMANIYVLKLQRDTIKNSEEGETKEISLLTDYTF